MHAVFCLFGTKFVPFNSFNPIAQNVNSMKQRTYSSADLKSMREKIIDLFIKFMLYPAYL